MRRSPGDTGRDTTGDRGAVRADGSGVELFEVTESPVIEYTLDAGTPVVHRVNPAFVDTFDITDEMAGIPLSTTMASVTATNDGASLLEAACNGEDTVVTYQCETATGETAFRVQARHTDGGGYVIFTETLSDERLDLLKYLTHSLRNPLEVATVHTDVIADLNDPDHIGTVRTAHERMETIISETMELAQQGSVVEETTTVDIAALARDAWGTAKTDSATLDIGSPGTVEADERRLQVLFENLFRNAVRHGTPDDDTGADIRVTVEATPSGFAVADNGRGIPAADREQVLDPGYTTAEDGTGLGLAIVAEIAESHGWEITVTESDTGGTCFEFDT